MMCRLCSGETQPCCQKSESLLSCTQFVVFNVFASVNRDLLGTLQCNFIFFFTHIQKALLLVAEYHMGIRKF